MAICNNICIKYLIVGAKPIDSYYVMQTQIHTNVEYFRIFIINSAINTALYSCAK